MRKLYIALPSEKRLRLTLCCFDFTPSICVVKNSNFGRNTLGILKSAQAVAWNVNTARQGCYFVTIWDFEWPFLYRLRFDLPNKRDILLWLDREIYTPIYTVAMGMQSQLGRRSLARSELSISTLLNISLFAVSNNIINITLSIIAFVLNAILFIYLLWWMFFTKRKQDIDVLWDVRCTCIWPPWRGVIDYLSCNSEFSKP